MNRRSIEWVPALAVMLCSACVGMRLGAPDEVVQDIVTAVDEERTEYATDVIEAVVRRPDLRDLVFPQLYAKAKARYTNDDPRGAAGLLRVLAAGYSEAISVRVGLAYSLLLLRGEDVDPLPEEVQELSDVLAEIDKISTNPPAWVQLARAQNSIDRNDLELARQALAQFHEEWDGEPASLAPYVDDLGRYLSSH